MHFWKSVIRTFRGGCTLGVENFRANSTFQVLQHTKISDNFKTYPHTIFWKVIEWAFCLKNSINMVLTKINEDTAHQRCCDVKGRKFLFIVVYLCCYIALTSHGFLTYCSSVNFYQIEKRKNTCLIIFRDLQNHVNGILEAKWSLLIS